MVTYQKRGHKDNDMVSKLIQRNMFDLMVYDVAVCVKLVDIMVSNFDAVIHWLFNQYV